MIRKFIAVCIVLVSIHVVNFEPIYRSSADGCIAPQWIHRGLFGRRSYFGWEDGTRYNSAAEKAREAAAKKFNSENHNTPIAIDEIDSSTISGYRIKDGFELTSDNLIVYHIPAGAQVIQVGAGRDARRYRFDPNLGDQGGWIPDERTYDLKPLSAIAVPIPAPTHKPRSL